MTNQETQIKARKEASLNKQLARYETLKAEQKAILSSDSISDSDREEAIDELTHANEQIERINELLEMLAYDASISILHQRTRINTHPSHVATLHDN